MVKVQVGEAAQILGISRDTVRRRAERGELAAERVDDGGKGHWLIDLPEQDGGAPQEPQDPPEVSGEADQRQVAVETRYMVDSVSVDVAVLRERVAGLERFVDELLEDKRVLQQQVQDAAAAQRELRVLLRQRDDVLVLGEGVRRPWWRRLFQ